MAKLIDILARELKAWPEGADFAVCVSDVKETFSVSYTAGGKPERDPYDRRIHPWTVLGVPGAEWFLRHDRQVIEKPCDRFSAIVTRAEWQAARDALISENPSLNLQEFGRITRVAPEWDGKGIPPLGLQIAFSEWKEEDWRSGKLLYTSEFTVVIHADDQPGEFVAHPARLRFLPIRTPEQIAADERRTGIEDIRNILSDSHGDLNSAIAIYDAGYRKQEQSK